MAETDLETQQTKAQNGKSPEASPEKKKEDSVDSKAKAMMCLVSGKRHLLCQDIASAVTSLGEACEMFAQEFGEKAPECAEAYFYYGKALLEMARLEAGVLGNIDTDDSEEKSEDEDGSEEDAEGEEKEEEKEEGTSKDEAEKSETEKENADEAEPEKEKEDIDGDNKEVEDSAEQAAEDEEDPSNLQLAWEMLELAKMVLIDQLEMKEKMTEEMKNTLEKRLFETFLILGEVSLENENYPQAVDDLTICLEKQKAVLPEDSRNIAVTYYQLGIALGFNMKYEEAIEKLEMAIGVLKKRIDNLINKTESVDESKKDDAFYTREKEIKELEALIPEIKEKITDTIEMKEESVRKIAEVKEQMGFGSGSSSGAGTSGEGSSSAKPISSISIKRKAEPATSESPKKVRSETEVLKENGQN